MNPASQWISNDLMKSNYMYHELKFESNEKDSERMGCGKFCKFFIYSFLIFFSSGIIRYVSLKLKSFMSHDASRSQGVNFKAHTVFWRDSWELSEHQIIPICMFPRSTLLRFASFKSNMKSTTAQTEFDFDGELNNFTFQYPNILLCNYQGYTRSKLVIDPHSL